MKMKSELRLVSNGKIEGYPEVLHLSIFKNKHWRLLTMAYQQSTRAFYETLSSCYDDVIDFTNLDITSSRQLTLPDRLKIFFYEFINIKGDSNISVFWNCSVCKKYNSGTIDLMKLDENKLKHTIKPYILNYKNKEYVLGIPVRSDVDLSEDVFKDYKSDVITKLNKLDKTSLESFTKESNKLLEEYYFLKTNGVPYILFADYFNDKFIENNDELNEEYIKFIKSVYKVDDKKDFFELKDNITDEETKRVFNILCMVDYDYSDDLFMDDYTSYLVAFHIFFKEKFKDNFLGYLTMMCDLEMNEQEKMSSYVKSLYHGFTEQVTVKCTDKECNHVEKINLDMEERFFFQ